MRYGLRLFFSCFVFVGFIGHAIAQIQQEDIPEPLRDWQEWVLWDSEFLDCPLKANGSWGNRSDHICSWPGRLLLDLDSSGGRFSLTWTLHQPGGLFLPGDLVARPLDVLVNDVPASVLFNGNFSRLELPAGKHRVTGRFNWDKMPESLYLPGQLALFELSIDGVNVEAPRFSQQNTNQLLLQTTQPINVVSSHSIKVSRHLEDAMPSRLSTYLEIQVSGPARQIELGQLLPPHFHASYYSGELPLQMDKAGNASLFVRPGTWTLLLDGQAKGLLSEVELSSTPASDGVEIWAVSGTPGLRSFRLEGLNAVDPDLVYTPWTIDGYPTYQFRVGEQLKVVELQRGLTQSREPKVNLKRRLWLSQNAKRWAALDTLQAEKSFIERLDVMTPWQLESASEFIRGTGARNLLVTEQLDTELAGVELRSNDLALTAFLTSEDTGIKLAANSWSQALQSLNLELNLGPGFQLLATKGVDSDGTSWLAQWQLLDWFLLLLLSLAMYYALGFKGAALALFAGLLSWQNEPLFLYLLLAIALVLIILHEFKQVSFAKGVGFIGIGLVAISALVFIVFAASQLAYTLYPQLHKGQSPLVTIPYYYEAYDAEPSSVSFEVTNAAEQVSSVSEDEDAADLNRISVTGSLIQKRARPVSAAPVIELAPLGLSEGALPQAGSGQPNWKWYRHHLTIDASVIPGQTLDLLILRPWQVVVWRLLSLVSLLLLLILSAKKLIKFQAKRKPSSQTKSVVGQVAILSLLCCWCLPLAAQSTTQLPTDSQLEELRERLLPKPQCHAECTGVAAANLQLDAERLGIQLRVHTSSQQEILLPGGEGVRLQAVRVNGQPSEEVRLYTRAIPIARLPLGIGIHRVELDYAIIAGDSFSLQFPYLPAEIDIQVDGWQVEGIRNKQLITEEIGFERLAVSLGHDAEAADELLTTTQLDVLPYGRLQRIIRFENEWLVDTVFTKLAPVDGNIRVAIPLLPGEQPLSGDLDVNDDIVNVITNSSVRWRSRLQRVNELHLVADTSLDYAEQWSVISSQQYHVSFSGVPASPDSLALSYQQHVFYPLPGEALNITLSQPKPIVTNTLAVDYFLQFETLGRSSKDVRLELKLRSNIAQDFTLQLPENAELERVELKSQQQQQELRAGVLTIPISSGDSTLSVFYREPVPINLLTSASEISFDAPVANIDHQLNIGQPRWILFIGGEGIKPAVLYWSQLVAMILVVVLLARLRWTPLKWWQWLLIGVGFSTIQWAAAIVLAAWLHAISWRQREPLPGDKGKLQQLVIILLAVVSLVAVMVNIPQSMLSTPDMQITGADSSASQLNWFIDYADNEIASRWFISLPLWCYQSFILIWALWLAMMLIRWLRWSIKAFDWQSWQTNASDKPSTSENTTATEPLEE